jgi:LysR family glycine cleavage system transcriptional activator
LSAAAPLLAAIHRTGSFSAAAAELGQTQSTVSHKVRTLEQGLGFSLFSRTTRHVDPTRQGRLICEAAGISVDALNDALDRIDKLGTARDTVLTLSSSLAMKWLVPAMSRARERGLRLTLDIDDALSEIGGDGQPQVAIRFGTGPYPGLHAELLAKCAVVAVRGKGTREMGMADKAHPAQLLRDVRAEADGTAMSWEDYLKAAELETVPVENATEFDRSDLALQAAMAGLGHVLGRTLLIDRDIGDGVLDIDGPAIPVAGHYWLVTTPETASTESYNLLAKWLKSEVKRSQAIMRSYLGT